MSSLITLPLFIAASVLLSLFALVYILYLYPNYLSPLRHAPGPPIGNPVFGQFRKILREESGKPQREWAEKYGVTMRVVGPVGLERMIFLSPGALRKILVSDWVEYPRPEPLRHLMGLVAGYGLFTVSSEEHRLLRKTMNPAFSIAALSQQTSMYYDPIYKLVDIIKSSLQSNEGVKVVDVVTDGNVKHQRKVDPENNGDIFHVFDWLSKLTLDIICLTAFGIDANSLDSARSPSSSSLSHAPSPTSTIPCPTLPNSDSNQVNNENNDSDDSLGAELASAYHNMVSVQNGKNVALVTLLFSIPGFVKMITSKWIYDRRECWRSVEKLFLSQTPLYALFTSNRRIKTIAGRILKTKVEAEALRELERERRQAALMDDIDSPKKEKRRKVDTDIMSLLLRSRREQQQRLEHRVNTDDFLDFPNSDYGSYDHYASNSDDEDGHMDLEKAPGSGITSCRNIDDEKLKSRTQLSDEEVIENVMTFLGAGHETIASGLAWALYLLASHPDIQRDLRAEINTHIDEAQLSAVDDDEESDETAVEDDEDSCLRKRPRSRSRRPEPDFKTLKRMELLEWVVLETLRLFPPVPMSVRRATKSDYIENIFVPKGTFLYIGIRVVNTYTGFWGPDAHEFRPTRWKKGNLPETWDPGMSYLPFGAGPCHCLGKTMAIVEMKAILSVLVREFEFEPAYEGQLARPTASVTMKPADNMPLRIRPVQRS